MAGEYSINLTNGTVLTTLYPLEVSGGISTPRQVLSISTTGCRLSGELAYRFTPGFIFDFINISYPTDPNIGTYVVQSAIETVIGLNTVTDITITTTFINTSVPFGQIQYSVPASSPLRLGGRGVMNWAEDILESSIHITENFANDTAPGVPVTGQHWYRTLSGSEGMLVFDGSSWVSTIDVDSGELRFKDSQAGPGIDMILSASAPGDNDFGLSLRPSLTSAPSTLSLFRVVDHTSTVEYLRVETGGYVRMYNSLEVQGGNDSYIYNRLGVGEGSIPSVTNTLTVEGSGIDVNAAAGFYANLNLNAVSNMKSQISFINNNLVKSEIFVDGTAIGTPLEINNSINTNVHLVSGTSTGFVGIGNSNPQVKLDVTGALDVSDRISLTASTSTIPTVGLYRNSTNLILSTNTLAQFQLDTTGKLSALTSSYETLVTTDNDIPNKKYVDDGITAALSGGGVVHITGTETITGAKTFSTTVNITGGSLNMNSNTITNVTDPTNPQDAATMKYVDDKFNLALALTVIGW